MGFINNSTNSIICDAIITDLGRQFISKNDGSFSIVKFAAGDDEVDYTIIRQFGRTIGQQKIELNTPIFEALTNQNYALKYRLVSVSNPNLIRMPTLSVQGTGSTTTGVVALGNVTQKSRSLTFEQTIQNESSIDVELRDQTFIVEMSNLFLYIPNLTPSVDGQQRATYLLNRDSTTTALGGSRLQFTLTSKSITDAQYLIYGAKNNKTIINTYMKVSGVNSGATLELQVQISKTG